MVFDVQGRSAVITGGAQGIGLSIAVELLKSGLKGVVLADIESQLGNEAITKLSNQFGSNKAVFLKTDVTKADQLEAAFKLAVSTFGAVDIVVNNAGMLKDSQWELEIAVNCNAVVQGSLLGIKYMGKNNGHKGGVIVNVASIYGFQEVEAAPVYGATKHFVVGLNKCFGAKYYYDLTGIKFLTMCPGITDTTLVNESAGFTFQGFPNLGKMLSEGLASMPQQTPEYVGQGTVTAITKGEHGSIWVSEGKEPAYELDVPDRRTMRKH
ncbi:15-hydroxyprostaglandin dehydrogenase [NAD(+)]-like [Diabrotica virgifera virgifera]|uniref:15-hydroxyprostaglandin dehydrogenase [NAD(+)]-like n=1 Tax=Diabrotica virgifera virgifera TaxID=50390 RepID=A0ABM5KH07_DIAVI|nr:15-hydroxyprostaglandin dehydrogenase [NAD(+)]-like [Diabrotica virgifera virgifera]